MAAEFDLIFARLRAVLKKHAASLSITDDTASKFALAGDIGPATVQAWRGKKKSPPVPVAWVEIGKAYVSYHLMPVYGCAKLRDGMSKELAARMQGKSCFNFKTADETLFRELDALTSDGIGVFRKARFIV